MNERTDLFPVSPIFQTLPPFSQISHVPAFPSATSSRLTHLPPSRLIFLGSCEYEWEKTEGLGRVRKMEDGDRDGEEADVRRGTLG